MTNDKSIGTGNQNNSRNYFGNFDLLFRTQEGQEFVFAGDITTKKYKHKGMKGHFEIRFIEDK